MRICLLSKEYPPVTGWGGIGAYNYQIAQGLRSLGAEVEVVSLATRTVEGKNSPDCPSESVTDGIRIHRLPWNEHLDDLKTLLVTMPTSQFVIKTNLALWTKFLEIHRLRPFDVVEAPEHLAEGLLPAVTSSLPVVIKLHTPYSKFIAERFHNVTPAFDHQFIAMLERAAMLSANALISPSEDLARYVAQDLSYPLEAIRIIKNPVDAETFCPEGPKALAPDGRLTVLFAGRLEERKGIHYLIAAIPEVIKEFSNVRFVIIGSDTETGKGKKPVLPELKRLVEQTGCRENVIFIPQVQLSEMPAYYRSADICLAPSLYDNAPYTCIEAMSTGKAFIGTTAGGMREYVTDGKSGLIIPAGDSGAIAGAVLRLLKNEAERLSLGHQARLYTLEKIHRTQVARENLEVYQQARANFQARRESSLYLRGDERSLADTNNLLFCYQKMLYDFLYQQSLRFRIRHWFSLLKKHPGLVLKKLAVASLSAGRGSLLAGKLRAEIAQTELDREMELKRKLNCA